MKNIIDTNIFCRRVEELVFIGNSYIEAVIKTCDEAEIDFGLASQFISKPIKEKIQQEAENINLLPKKSKLPI